MKGLKFKDQQVLEMTTKEYRAKIHTAYVLESLWKANCFRSNDDRGPRDAKDNPIPRAPFERHRVFTGYFGRGTYNHHMQLAKWRGRWALAFSNCERDEDRPGQRTMISFSEDLHNWTEAVEIIPADKAAGMGIQTGGIYADDDQIVVYAMARWNMKAAKNPGMTIFGESESQIGAWRSTDGLTWQMHADIIHNAWIFEGPRATREGKLLASGARDGEPLAYLWDPKKVASSPEVVVMPKTPEGMSLFHAEASWYQLDSGRIMMFWRDEGATERLAFTASDDGGRTWMDCVVTDIPDSMSRVYAGRLSDGRYYLVGNTWPKLLDRTHLMLSLSEDGETFSEIYTLVDDPTTQRAAGLLKADGYAYPCCAVDGDKLIVAYSVNKEDIEVGVVDTTRI